MKTNKNSKKKITGIAEDSMWKNVKKYWAFCLMILPGMIWFLMFRYIPILGSVIAFEDYSVFKGMFDSPWVGLKHFKALLGYSDFLRVLRNTMVLGFCKTVLIFPVPVILSFAINEISVRGLKKGIQTAIYIPHFLSWAIVGGLVFDFFGVGGVFNNIRNGLGLPTRLLMQEEAWFRPIYIITSIWKEAGWGTVVYLAAISGIDPSLYEAAVMDGASRFQRIRYVTFPLLIPTMLTLFLMGIGGFLDLGFEQLYSLLTPMTYSVGDVFATYVYRVGILNGQYSSTTAIGLFQSIVGFILVSIFNKLANRYSDGGGLY